MTAYVYNIVKCPFCNEERKSTGLHMHIKTHGDKIWEEYKLSKKKEVRSVKTELGWKCIGCEFIGLSVQSTSSHWWRNHTDDGRSHIPVGTGRALGSKTGSVRTAPAWNKDLTKEDPRVRKYVDANKLIFEEKKKKGIKIKITPMSEENRKKLSERQSLNNTGGKCKWYDVGNQKVQGRYELYFAEKLNEQKIKWEKVKTNNHIFSYEIDGRYHSYSPDFYLPEFDLYVEIKGFWWGNDKKKMEIVKSLYIHKKLVVLCSLEKIKNVCVDIKKNLPLEPVWSW